MKSTLRSAPICLALCASLLVPARASTPPNAIQSELGGNTADARQAGSGNNANISQSGTGNRATVIQSGTANRAIVRQTGTDGSATAEQRGDGRQSRIVQGGNPAGQITIRQTTGD